MPYATALEKLARGKIPRLPYATAAPGNDPPQPVDPGAPSPFPPLPPPSFEAGRRPEKNFRVKLAAAGAIVKSAGRG